ncbi:hypothetical protein LAZ67_3005160 [Cordylochernes scorpioides]|uniref:Helix-turn-helix domain-containing protein n=1 Tax=Cordylochernes scorpioides TaxID=51811 RepID=A0ABY6KAU9_9ARAC|nr:hypothetical protein LAZ67_3005160 [Cordylochernes scorpioides]
MITITKRHRSKLNYWVKRYNFPESCNIVDNQGIKGIINLSSETLTPLENRLLSLGLKFRMPKTPDIPRIISCLEPAIKSLSHQETFKIRQAVTSILQKPVPHTKESKADYIVNLTSLCLDMNIFTFNQQYYKQIRGSPMGSPLSSIVAEIVMNNSPPHYTHYSSHCPITHKISLVKTLTKRIFTHCSLTIFQYIEKSKIIAHLTNANYPISFINRHFYNPNYIKPAQINKSHCTLPYSPHSVAIASLLKPYGIKTFYHNNPNIASITRNPITRSNKSTNNCNSDGAVYAVPCRQCSVIYVGGNGYSRSNNNPDNPANHQHYKQIRGTPMGSLLSSIVAEVVMGSLDQWINQTHSSDIHYWRRYVDDIFCIIKPNELQPILNTLHSFHADIKFTYETETNLVLPFLDILIIRTPHRLHTAVYYKKNIPPLYTHFSSNSPVAYKVNTVRTLTKRMHTHCSLPIFKAIEKNRITTLLTTAGYPRKFIDKHTFDPTAPRTSTTYRAVCYLPYSSFSVTISRILRPYGIQVYFNSPPNLAALLRNPITKADTPNNPIHSTGAVYAVSCQDCPASYVGETGRTAYIRITEHKRNINNRDPKSLIYQHISNTGHNFNLDHPKILYQHINNKQHRLVLESIISTQTNSINRKIDLPEIYHIISQ